MGFETQEEAERWAEEMEFRAEQRKEEEMFLTPKERAWKEITRLPAYQDMSAGARELQRAVFDYAWDAALRTS
jgi:hypothetical protein